MKVWITKYALTKGIFELEVTKTSANYAVEDAESNNPVTYYKNEWTNDRKSAVAKAEEMRKKKIKSLKNQLDKLENLKFN